MLDFKQPVIEIAEISEDNKFGRFVVEPLERGYGTTLGNSLRRIMLSSLPGVAVSQVKIDGVVHEFSGIPGVKEDVTEIIMNLKNLAIKNTSETLEDKIAYIDFEGEGVVTAANIQADPDIEILNPDLVIATLNGGPESRLYMELTIKRGHGYVSADKNKTENMAIGVIPIDSIFTPVERVNLTVENTRVGQITDFDKLTLDVFTNGILAPEEAVSLAAKADTLFVYTLSKPHNYRRTCAVASDNYYRVKPCHRVFAGSCSLGKSAAVLKKEIVSDCGNERQNNGYYSRDEIHLRLVVLCNLAESRENDCKELNYNRSVNVG